MRSQTNRSSLACEVFFSPFAYIWPHDRLEAALRRCLTAGDRRVLLLRCRGMLWSNCMVKHAVGEHEKNLGPALCERCANVSKIPERNTDVIVLDDVEVPLQFQSSLRLREDQILDYITRAVLYEESLVSRRPLDKATAAASPEMQKSITLCHRLLRLIEVIFVEQQPKRVFYYNDVYAVNRVVKLVADELGIQTVNLHLSLIPSRMWDHFVATNSRESLLTAQRTPRYASALTRKDSRKVTQAFRFQEFGTSPFVYSARGKRHSRRSRGLRQTATTGKRQQILLALSSHDEMDALKGLLPNELAEASYEQEKTLNWFLEVASLNCDVDFIIRPHPREFPNRRHEGMTPSADRFIQLTRSLPPNVRLDMPESGTSLFSLVRLSQAVIFTWSSIGLEALILGKHTATATPNELTWCPNNLFPHIQSKDEMADFVEFSLNNNEWPRDRLNALRWYAWFLATMDNSFSAIPYRVSPARLMHGLVGRSRIVGWRHMLPFLRRMEILASRRRPLQFPHPWVSDELYPPPMSWNERRLIKRLSR